MSGLDVKWLKNVFSATSAAAQISATVAAVKPLASKSCIAASMIRARTSSRRRSRRLSGTIAVGAAVTTIRRYHKLTVDCKNIVSCTNFHGVRASLPALP